MKFGQKLRHFWHSIYYRFSGQKGVEFALRCQQVAHHIDHSPKPDGFIKKIRFYLHISLCQACKNYYDYSRIISHQAKKITQQNKSTSEAQEKINQRLILDLTNTKREI